MKLKITVDGKLYEVEVEASEPEAPHPAYVPPVGQARVPAAAPPPSPVSGDDSKVCRSPIAGTVVRVAAQSGQAIQTGDVLLVLEAMKMETNITAPLAGKVAEVKVQQGDAVQSGQVVVEFE